MRDVVLSLVHFGIPSYELNSVCAEEELQPRRRCHSLRHSYAYTRHEDKWNRERERERESDHTGGMK